MVEQRKEQDTVKAAEEVGKKVLPLLEQIGGIVASAGLTDENGYVQIMLWQLEELLKADVEPIIEQKINRQLQRIKESGK